MKRTHIGTRIVMAVLLTGSFVGAVSAADTPFQKNHPRREQVNARLANQNKRIQQEVKEGELTHAQAATLRREDRRIRSEA